MTNFVDKSLKNAGVAQLVERHLAKVEVAGSSLVSRSLKKLFVIRYPLIVIYLITINFNE